MADLGLNVFQVIQNELIQREGNRSTLGIGYRLAVIEEKVNNSEASNRNSKVWKPWHAIAPISAQTPESRDECERARRKLLSRKGADRDKDDKDPTKLPRDEEKWEVHADFPRTVLQFKELQFHPDIIRTLLDFYQVRVYRPDFRIVNIKPEDQYRDIKKNLETCLEELAMHFGLNWQRIGGLQMPTQLPPHSPTPPPPPPSMHPDHHAGFSSLPRWPHGNY